VTDLVNLRLHLLEQSPGFPQASLPANRKRKSHPNQSLEDRWADLSELDQLLQGYRDSTLDKWWAKAHGSATATTKFKAVNQSASAQVRNVLEDRERLRKRTRLWRSRDGRALGRAETEASTQSVDAHLSNTDPEIFDDSDFYGLLLKELIDSRGSSAEMDPMQLASNHLLLRQLADRKKKASKKQVDTRASKGRKIRYQVMEKLRNFMTPVEVQGMEEGMKDELFGNLFGGFGKAEGKSVDAVVDAGFKLFG